jgi:hypothetical protein
LSVKSTQLIRGVLNCGRSVYLAGAAAGAAVAATVTGAVTGGAGTAAATAGTLLIVSISYIDEGSTQLMKRDRLPSRSHSSRSYHRSGGRNSLII